MLNYKNKVLQQILSLIILVTFTCSCTTIKLGSKKDDKSKSITQINCNKIKGIDSRRGKLNNQELVLTGEHYKADSNKTLILNLAKDGYTRILFKDEIITDVFFYPEDALQVSIHNSGYLVVMPLSNELPVQLTVTTRNGVTQDLLLKFIEKKPQPITLIKGGKNVK